MKQCSNCLAPMSDTNISWDVCSLCIDIQWDIYQLLEKSNVFTEEMDLFLKDRKKVVFAYSGWLDSTVVLNKLNRKCKEHLIELLCFTIDHWYKWHQAHKNIEAVIESEWLKNAHQRIDITNRKNNGKKNIEIYNECIQQDILPCGPTCNKIIDASYKKILDQYNEDILITGWDTPKFNKRLERYSIFREKPEFNVLRGGVAFWLNKQSNQEYIRNHNIPREDPWCGWYDTDCLIPGTILRNLVKKKEYSYDNICHHLPQIVWYLSERVRRWIIDKDDALQKIQEIDIANDSSYREALEIFAHR